MNTQAMLLPSATKTKKKKGRNKAKPFHAQHHPVKQAMHLNMASGLSILRSVFYLQHFFSIFTLCMFCTVTLAMEGVTRSCTCHAILSCFRGPLGRTPYRKPLLFSILYFWVFFLKKYLWVTPKVRALSALLSCNRLPYGLIRPAPNSVPLQLYNYHC